MDIDVVSGIFLLALIIPLGLAYFFHIKKKGRPRYDRIDQQGGSKLLGKTLMEMGYWAMQPLGRLLTALHVSPNTLTWISMLFGLGAGVYAAMGYFGSAALFLSVAALLDAADGMVARMTGTASRYGYVLDSQLDRYVEFLFLGGLVVYYRHNTILMVMALAALLGSYMVSYTTLMARFKQVPLQPGSVLMRRAERIVYLLVGSALSAISVRWIEGGFPQPTVVGYPMVVALGLIALVANFSAFNELFKMLRVLRAQDEAEKAEKLAAAAEKAAQGKPGSDSARTRPVPAVSRH